MPTYTFECDACKIQGDVTRGVDERNDRVVCPECKEDMHRIPERFTPDFFEPYFDEGLGRDIRSRTERRIIMKDLGVVEAGDPVKGSRNFDEAAPNTIGKLPLQGINHISNAQKEEIRDNKVISVVDKEGNTVDKAKVGDISTSFDSLNYNE